MYGLGRQHGLLSGEEMKRKRGGGGEPAETNHKGADEKKEKKEKKQDEKREGKEGRGGGERNGVQRGLVLDVNGLGKSGAALAAVVWHGAVANSHCVGARALVSVLGLLGADVADVLHGANAITPGHLPLVAPVGHGAVAVVGDNLHGGAESRHSLDHSVVVCNQQAKPKEKKRKRKKSTVNWRQSVCVCVCVCCVLSESKCGHSPI